MILPVKELFVFCRCQLGSKKVVQVAVIEAKWHDLALPKELFDELLRIGNLTGDVEWLKFFALACSSLAEVWLFCLMICQLFML